MILANNHPSGISEPSHAGKVMRVQIKKGLGIVDMRTLAHFTSEVSPRCPSLNG
ncbi:JAB domain-containing protein, partial [Klebsiella pneumoniae]|nr:JAB domain-containing protein [Klebsiella pneumoniae]